MPKAMKRPKRAWTDDERKLLFKRFVLDHEPYFAIADELKREQSDVQKMGKQMGLWLKSEMASLIKHATEAARERGVCVLCGQRWNPPDNWGDLHNQVLEFAALLDGSRE